MSTVDPGDGWRLLGAGEEILGGDEYWFSSEWWPVMYSRGRLVTNKLCDIWRRRVEPIDNSGIDVTTGGPYIAIEVHRAALAEIERLKLEKQHLCAHLDAKYEDEKQLKAELDAYKTADEWKYGHDEISQACSGELAQHVRNDVMYRRSRIDGELLKSVEHPQPDPEPEWFDLTPFGEHVLRRKVDQCEYDGEVWQEVCDISGWTITKAIEIDFTEFRCLLKDAPPELVAKAKEPQQPKTETVVFYEFAVKCGHANKNLQLKWRDAKPAGNDWIPTGRTETREVVR